MSGLLLACAAAACVSIVGDVPGGKLLDAGADSAESDATSGGDDASSEAAAEDAAPDADASGEAMVPTCSIAGVTYASGAANPANPCESCDPAVSASAWTDAADGVSCGNGQVCAKGNCGSQCDINGTIYASGAANPANACQTCQPGTSTTAFSDADGIACGDAGAPGDVCYGGSCVACEPNQTRTDPNPCGNCGTDTETCVNGQWHPGTCMGQGPCGGSETQTCNTYGTQACKAATCTWGACSCPSAPVCTPGATQCSGTEIQTCNSCGQWSAAAACPSGQTCGSNHCNCTLTVTSQHSVTNPYGAAVAISYSMVGGGGGGGSAGGGGGSSAILVGGNVQAVAAGGAGAPAYASPSSSGTVASGSFALTSGATLTVYVGGGGGGYGGGGGCGYYGGGGGSASYNQDGLYIPGGGGGTSGGSAGAGAQAGSSLQGGTGENDQTGSPNNAPGGTATTGGVPNAPSYGAGGGALGGGGGGAGVGSGNGGNAGGDGTGGTGTGTSGGLGALNWASATTLPAAAGQGTPGSTVEGGNAGLVILTYTPPNGMCEL